MREMYVISGTAIIECLGFVIGCVFEKYGMFKCSLHEMEVLHDLILTVGV